MDEYHSLSHTKAGVQVPGSVYPQVLASSCTVRMCSSGEPKGVMTQPERMA